MWGRGFANNPPPVVPTADEPDNEGWVVNNGPPFFAIRAAPHAPAAGRSYRGVSGVPGGLLTRPARA